MSIRATGAVALALSASALLAACGGGSNDSLGGDDGGAGPHSLGLMELTVNGIGSGEVHSQAQLISQGAAGAHIKSAALSPEAAGIDVVQVSATTVDVGTRGSGGERYVSVVYKVRNAQFCGTPDTCTAYSGTHNLTMIAAATASNLSGTAVTNIFREDGTTDSTEQALATTLLPTHGMAPTNPAGGVMLATGEDSLQVFTESEVAGVPLDSGATGLFPYGYVVRNTSSTSTRVLPDNPPNGEYDGQLTFSFKFPLQASQANDPFSISFIFQVVDDTHTRVTQSAEEQNVAGDLAATVRAEALGSTDLVVLGGRIAETNLSDPICSVRTAGTAASPTAYLANNPGVTLGGAPFNLALAAGDTVNSGFCASMSAATPTTLVVSGSQSGTRTVAGPYKLNFANANNVLSFTPDATHPFFPGETVSISYTTGLTSSASAALARSYVGSYTVKTPVATTGTFAGLSNPAAGGNTNGAAIGDFNGDGKLDLAVANYGDDTVTILLGNGAGGFAAASGSPLTVGSGTGAYAVVAADFNGDGKLDLAAIDHDNGKVALFAGNGSGGFGAAVLVTVANPNAIGVGDLNGDGAPDLVVTTTDDKVVVLKNNGSGSFTAGTPISSVGVGLLGLSLGDFNGDGKLDLALAASSDGMVNVLLGDGNGGFGTPQHYPTGSNSFPNAVVAGDFNGDGKLDLALSDGNNSFMVLLLGNGDGSFAGASEYTEGGATSPAFITAGDFDGDGRLDLAFADFGSNTVTVMLNSATGFGSRASYTVGSTDSPFPAAVYAGDFNNDGVLDLVVPDFTESDVSVLLGVPSL